jgi:DNA-directed RNA polymerase subunit omega
LDYGLWKQQTCAGVLGKAVFRRKLIPKNDIAFKAPADTLRRSKFREFTLNAELTKKALEKVGNPNVLINLVSRRVRQLNSGAGAISRPLISDVGNMGLGDIALTEIIEDKIGFEMPELVELVRPSNKKKKKS